MICPYCQAQVDADEMKVRIERTLNAGPPAHAVIWWSDPETGLPDFSRDPVHECRAGALVDG